MSGSTVLNFTTRLSRACLTQRAPFSTAKGRGPMAVTVKASQHELWVRAVTGSNPSHFVGMKLKSIIMAVFIYRRCIALPFQFINLLINVK